MRDIKYFPFDCQNVVVWLRTASDFASREWEHQGNSSGSHRYRIQPCSEAVKVHWHGENDEWNVHAISSEFWEEGVVEGGYEPSNIRIHFHLSRYALELICNALFCDGVPFNVLLRCSGVMHAWPALAGSSPSTSTKCCYPSTPPMCCSGRCMAMEPTSSGGCYPSICI